MLIYVSLPGQTKTPVIIADSATFGDFVKEAHKKTGSSIFNGLQPLGQGTVKVSPFESGALKANIYDNTTSAFINLATVTFATAITSVFSNGDSILILNNPIGG